MPDKPTDKKLTFVEWVAYYKISLGELDKNDLGEAKKRLQNITNAIIYNGLHNINCINIQACVLCTLQNWLSEYHKYFQQK